MGINKWVCNFIYQSLLNLINCCCADYIQTALKD